MYFVFNRDTLQLEGCFDNPKNEHNTDKFIALEMTDEQIPFRKALDRLHVTHLEVKLMYRNAGDIEGPINDHRDSVISYLYHLLASGKAKTRHTATLFTDDVKPAQSRVSHVQSIGVTVVPTRAPSAPRGGNRANIFEVADRMWSEAGHPRDTSIVLRLRKTIMLELESNYGIKKTTSSTALGEWMKIKLNPD